MKDSKKLDELLEDNQRKLRELFKYVHKRTLAFTPEDKEKVRNKFGVYMIFGEKKPVFVGQAKGYSSTHQPINSDLYTKLGQYNSRSETGTTKFRKAYAQNEDLNSNHLKGITAGRCGFAFQYIKIKDEPAFVNVLEIPALEYTKNKGYELYNFQ